VIIKIPYGFLGSIAYTQMGPACSPLYTTVPEMVIDPAWAMEAEPPIRTVTKTGTTPDHVQMLNIGLPTFIMFLFSFISLHKQTCASIC
jgi:hypothetical protein